MQTVMKKAFNRSTGHEYDIELPSRPDTKNALLELEYPDEGLRTVDIEKLLVEKFSLTDEQKNAKSRHNQRVFYFQILGYISGLVRAGTLIRLQTGLIVDAEKTGECVAQTNENATSFGDAGVQSEGDGTILPPEKTIERNYQHIRGELAAELLGQIKDNSPTFFEELVIDLLVQMGYGGSREDAARAVGGSGDKGIDGIINQDRLGLDVVYIQAKRWQENVQRRQIREFAGALEGQRARKGIVITTSDFSRGAREYVNTINSKIVLIDGRQLAELMIEYNVGVSTVKTYEIKRVDSDYFIDTDDSQTQDS